MQIKLIPVGKIMNYPRKAKPLSDFGFSLLDSDKIFSGNFGKNLSTLSDRGLSNPDDDRSILSVSVSIFSPVFSEYYRNTQSFRLHSMIERSICLELDVDSFGYVIYFDRSSKRMKSTFYFMSKHYNGHTFSDEKVSEIKSKIDNVVASKVSVFKGLTLSENPSTKELSKLVEGYNATIPFVSEQTVPSEPIAKAVFDFSLLMTDSAQLAAMARSLRGLDYSRAKILQTSINALISANGDPSIPLLELPAKFSREKSIDTQVSENQALTEDFGSIVSL